MKERVIDIKQVSVHAECDCGGEFRATGMTLLSSPPWYVHQCTKCRVTENFRISYPTIRNVPV